MRKIPSGSQLRDAGTYLFGFAALENPRSHPLNRKHFSAGLPCAILIAHVSIPSERKALIGFSA